MKINENQSKNEKPMKINEIFAGPLALGVVRSQQSILHRSFILINHYIIKGF